MSETWVQERRRRQARRARLAIAVAVVVLFGIALLIGGRSSTDDASSIEFEASPGDAAGERTTEPFSMAEPRDTGGPTTIPLFDPSSTTTTAEPPTTQAPRASVPDLPATDSITSLCGLSRSIQSVSALTQSSEFDEAAVADQLRANLARSAEVAPDQRELLEQVAEKIDGLLTILQENGWDARAPRVEAAIEAVEQRSPPFADLKANLEELEGVESQQCS